MKLEHEFYKLPLRFDIDRLNKELSSFADSEWQKHPSGYKGNLAIPLISVDGEINDAFAGPMLPTKHLGMAPYIQQVIASFKSVFGRSRLMRLEGLHEVPLHSDINYHWYSRVRIHIPIITTPDVIFHCADQQVHMAPGEAWIFDAWKMHKVVNPSGHTRVHLVIDTAGSDYFWELTKKAKTFSSDTKKPFAFEPKLVEFQPDLNVNIQTERFNVPLVMSPGEVDGLIDNLAQDVLSTKINTPESVQMFQSITNKFKRNWRNIWSLHGPLDSGWNDYEKIIGSTKQYINTYPVVKLENGADAYQVLTARILHSALHPELADAYHITPTHRKRIQPNTCSPAQAQNKLSKNGPCPCGSGKKYKRCCGA